jgi:hypothetical protein
MDNKPVIRQLISNGLIISGGLHSMSLTEAGRRRLQ